MTDPLVRNGYVQTYDTLLYRVRPGDNLTRILKRYHITADETQLRALVHQVRKDNPGLTNPDLIKPDQLIRLNIPQQYCSSPSPWQYLYTIRAEESQWISAFERTWNSSTKEERTLMSYLLPAFVGAGSAKLSALETTFTSNQPLLTAMVDNYESYKSGSKTKGQYDYGRKKLVMELTTKLGPTSVLVNGNQPPPRCLEFHEKEVLFQRLRSKNSCTSLRIQLCLPRVVAFFSRVFPWELPVITSRRPVQDARKTKYL